MAPTPELTEQEREWDRINGTVGYTAVFNNKAPGLLRLYELGGGHLITTGTDDLERLSASITSCSPSRYVGLPARMPC